MRTTTILLLSSLTFFSLPDVSYAGKGKPEINVKNFTYSKLFNQKEVWKKNPDVSKTEGLSNLIEKFPEDLSESTISTISEMLSSLPANDGYTLLQNKTSEDLDRELVEDFLAKKKAAMTKTLVINEIPACWDATCVGFSCVTGLGGQFGVATAFGRLIVTAKEALRDALIGGNDILSSDSDPLEKLEIEYVKKKRFLSYKLQEKIEAMFTAARQNDKLMGNVLEELPMFLNMPIHSNLPNDDFEESINTLAAGYTTEGKSNLADALNNFCAIHLSRFQEPAGPNSKRKRIIGLVGEAGLGKSHIAKEIAKIMRLNAVEVSLAGGMDDFLGNAKNTGALMRAIGNQTDPNLNDLFVLEELDRLLNEDKKAIGPALRVLDPQATELDLGYGMFDWSHAAIIVLMNNKPTSKEICDRMQIIEITGVVKENKENILTNKILPKILKSSVPGIDVKMEDLPAAELKQIVQGTDHVGFRQQEEELIDLYAREVRKKLSEKKTPRITVSALDESVDEW